MIIFGVNWAVVIVTKALHRHDISHLEITLSLDIIFEKLKASDNKGESRCRCITRLETATICENIGEAFKYPPKALGKKQ